MTTAEKYDRLPAESKARVNALIEHLAEETPEKKRLGRYNLKQSKALLAHLLEINFTEGDHFVTLDYTKLQFTPSREWARLALHDFFRRLKQPDYIYALDWGNARTARIVLKRDATGAETAAEAGARLDLIWECGGVKVERIDLSSGWGAVAARLGAWERLSPHARAWTASSGVSRPGERGAP